MATAEIIISGYGVRKDVISTISACVHIMMQLVMVVVIVVVCELSWHTCVYVCVHVCDPHTEPVKCHILGPHNNGKPFRV